MNEFSEDNEEQEKSTSIFVECPHCHTKILPHADNTCPACQGDLADLTDLDPKKVLFTIYESEELPFYCHSCNQYTEQEVRISGDQETILSKFFMGNVSPEETSNVVIFLPICEFCAEAEDPEPTEVDYDQQSMTFMVHAGFCDRVNQIRESQGQDDDDPDIQ